MRAIRLLALLLVCLSFAACSATALQDQADAWPEEFEEALAETHELSTRLERHIVAKSWVKARKEADELFYVTKHLRQYEPMVGVESQADYKTFEFRVDGLHFAAHKIRQYTNLHRYPEAVEWVDEYVSRYNKIASQFSNGELMDVNQRPPVDYYSGN